MNEEQYKIWGIQYTDNLNIICNHRISIKRCFNEVLIKIGSFTYTNVHVPRTGPGTQNSENYLTTFASIVSDLQAVRANDSSSGL